LNPRQIKFVFLAPLWLGSIAFLPVVNEKDFYPVHFSRGALLEADLIASTLRESSAGGMRVIRLVAWVRIP